MIGWYVMYTRQRIYLYLIKGERLPEKEGQERHEEESNASGSRFNKL